MNQFTSPDHVETYGNQLATHIADFKQDSTIPKDIQHLHDYCALLEKFTDQCPDLEQSKLSHAWLNLLKSIIPVTTAENSIDEQNLYNTHEAYLAFLKDNDNTSFESHLQNAQLNKVAASEIANETFSSEPIEGFVGDVEESIDGFMGEMDDELESFFDDSASDSISEESELTDSFFDLESESQNNQELEPAEELTFASSSEDNDDSFADDESTFDDLFETTNETPEQQDAGFFDLSETASNATESEASTDEFLFDLDLSEPDTTQETVESIEESDDDFFSDYQESTHESDKLNELILDLQQIKSEISQSQLAEYEVNQSLVALVCSEMRNILDDLQIEFISTIESSNLQQALSIYTATLNNLAVATETVELNGLNYFFRIVILQSEILTQQNISLIKEDYLSLTACFSAAVNYLDDTKKHDTCKQLSDFLQMDFWPQPLSSKEAENLISWLQAATLIDSKPDSGEQRATEAKEEDISLQLPDDVNQDLLSSLLQELPTLTSDFSSAIQRITEGGTLQDVDISRRVAHTLKGAANTVGIKGIANLTHHIEDILDIFAAQSALPQNDLALVLTEASDCLEGMTEHLLGMSPPPEDAVPVLQKVLDWTNSIIAEGIPETAFKQASQTENQERTAQPSPAPATVDNTSKQRLSGDLVDNLFRLSNENMVLSGQVENRVSHAILNSKLLKTQNNTLHQLVLDLDRLSNIEGLKAQQEAMQNNSQFDALEMDQYNELHTLTARLMESATDAAELTADLQKQLNTLETLMLTQQKLLSENQDVVLKTRMTSLQSIASRCNRTIRQACRLTNKDVNFMVEGGETQIDSEVLAQLVDPLMHLLRNAVDHGIEPSEQRSQTGKSEKGNILLKFSKKGDQIIVSCQDDGAGLNLPAIEAKAIEKNIIDSQHELSDAEISRLILAPGFSTRQQTTQVSGRGVGMDIVYSKLQKLKGRIAIHTEFGEGSRFEMILPATLTSIHALLVNSNLQKFALSNNGVEQILFPGTGELKNEDGKLFYHLEDKVIPAFHLETLLKQPLTKEDLDQARPAFLIKDETDKENIIMVKEVLKSQEVIVKNLGYFLTSYTGVVGATILGDGSVAPVFDLLELVATENEYILNVADINEQAFVTKLPEALVVDDSLSARKTMSQFMQDFGFNTRTAIDGVDAMELVQEQHPDIILIDMEMPRMNGIEFTTLLRSNNQTKSIPVIMVTSRSTSKHRQEASQAGVDAYITKPFSEDEVIENVNKLLVREPS